MAGTANKEGLPNILAVGTGYWRSEYVSSPLSGAAYTIYDQGVLAGSGGDAKTCRTGAFDASRSNSIYGRSADVMPASVNLPICLYLGRAS